MKLKLLILTVATFIAMQAVFAQSIEKQITVIRAEVTAINQAAKGYKKTVKDVEGISLEGTEATYFTSGKGLRKVVAKSYGETFNAVTELYFQGEELIFVYRKFNRYDTQIGMNPPPKVVSVKESRLYFAGGKMIRFLDGKKSVKNTTKFWSDSESEVNALSKTLKEAF
jgi:hypothetical protein